MKVYAYGAKAPTGGAQIVDQQIARAHRYYNVLIGLEREKRDSIKVVQGTLAATLKEAYGAAAEAIRGLEDPANEKLIEQLVLASTGKPTKWRFGEAASARAWTIAWEAWATWRQAFDSQVAPLHEQFKERAKQERARCGTFWGTYLQIEEAVMRAVQATPIGSPLHGRPWEEEGLIAVQLQGGLTSPELLGGKDSRVRLLGDGRHRDLWIRVGSEARDPVWATFPIRYHRDLPEGATIKRVRVHRRKVATHHIYSAQLVLSEPPAPLPIPTLGTVGIDVGWRRFPGEGMRVAAWADDAGQHGELRVPERLLTRWQKVDDLRSIRDKNFNVALKVLVEARKAATAWPPDLLRETTHLHAWESPARLAALIWRWRTQRFDGDGALYDIMEAWRKQDKHLYEWECNQRENVLRSRREIYRLFAKSMARYRTVVVERLDLTDFAEHPAPGEAKEAPELVAARGRRHFAALSELLGCLAQMTAKDGSLLRETNPADSTNIHHACGSKETVGSKLLHTCSKCGATFDQDENAAANLLARALTATSVSKRVRADVRNAQGLTPAEVRRQRGLETRRSKHVSGTEEAGG